MCVPSFFFYMGFWNFIAGSVLLLFTAGYVLRRTQRWTGRSLAALTVLACLLYGAHAVPWAVGVVAVAVLCLSDLALAYAMRRAGTPLAVSMRPGAVARHLVLPLLAVLVPAAALWLHLSRASQTPGCGPDTGLLAILWPLYSLSFLHSLTVADIPLLKMLGAAVLLAAAAVAGVAIVRGGYERRSTGMLLLSLACAAIAIAGPDCIGTGLFVRSRVAFFSFIFLLAWMASALQRWPKPLLHGIPAVFCLFAVAFMATRIPVVARWNGTLAGVTEVGQHVRPNSTVLQLDFAPLEGIDPALHAVGLILDRPIINLRNYEALADHFTTRFRPEMSPVPALGTMAQIRGVPPVFDVARYERETRGRVDYLLFNGWPEPRQAGRRASRGRAVPRTVDRFHARRNITRRPLPPLRARGSNATLTRALGDFSRAPSRSARRFRQTRRPTSPVPSRTTWDHLAGAGAAGFGSFARHSAALPVCPTARRASRPALSPPGSGRGPGRTVSR